MTLHPVEPQRSVEDPPREAASGRRLLAGGSVLAVAMLAANAGNYLLNLLLGRWLTPSEFADANLMVTLMLLVTAVAAPLQLVAARSMGVHEARGTADRGRSTAVWLHRRARAAGLVLAVLLGAPAIVWSDLLHTGSAWPFVILAAGMPAYLVQAVRRGVLQGRLAFGRLAASFVVEMVARVAIGLGLVASGFGVEGATFGLTLSFVATWAVVRSMQPLEGDGMLSTGELGDVRRFVAPTVVLLVGQIIINNGDVLVVKATFPGDEAGVYSAIALIGRGVFFVTWSAVVTIFPAAARRNEQGAGSDGLLLGGLAVVASSCCVLLAAIAVAGDRFLTSMFGPEYAGVDHLLLRYAMATSLFAAANLVATHRLSLGSMRETRILVAGALLQAALVLAVRDSIERIVGVQLLSMAVLLVAVVGSVAAGRRRSPVASADLAGSLFGRRGGSPA